jgi:hypothetical protein
MNRTSVAIPDVEEVATLLFACSLVSIMEVLVMVSRLKCLATVPILLGSLAVFGLLLLLAALKVPDKLARAMGYTGEPTIVALDLHPYTPEAAYKLLSDYGEAGRRATILVHLLFDLLLPVAYTIFFSSSFTLLGERTRLFPRLWRWAAVLPWFAGGFDLLENAGIITMARSYPTQRKWLARLTSVATRLKWGFFNPIQLLWLAGGLMWLLQWVGGRRRPPLGVSGSEVEGNTQVGEGKEEEQCS